MEFQELQQIVESNTLTIQALGRRIAEVSESVEQTTRNVNGLIQTIAEFSMRSEARINQLDEIIQRLDASDRLDRTTGIQRRLDNIEEKIDRLLQRSSS